MNVELKYKDTISKILKVLTFLAISITVIGYSMFVLSNPESKMDYSKFDNFAALKLNIFWKGLCSLDPFYITYLGIIILLSIPFVRIILSTFTFYVSKNKRYTLVGSSIIAILILSAIIGSL